MIHQRVATHSPELDMVDNLPSDAQASSDMKELEREEEAKLKAKYPAVSRPGPGLLQKRLQKGVRPYFD